MKRRWEDILSIFRARNVRIFLVFVLVSTLIWFIERLRQNYTVMVDVPIECVNVPEGFVVSEQLPKIKIMITSDGTTVFGQMLRKELITVPVDVNALGRKVSKNGRYSAVFLPKMITNYLQENLPDHIELKSVLTDSIYIELLTVKRRDLTVKLTGEPTIAPQHISSKETLISPAEVTIWGTNNVVDTMQYVYTKMVSEETISDTASYHVALDLPDCVRSEIEAVDVTYYVEPFTEKILEVGIIGLNVPFGYHFRAFPATVRVSCNVGLSRFDEFTAQDIDICADLSSVKVGNQWNERLKLVLRNYPPYVQNISYSPIFVDYLLERDMTVALDTIKTKE